MSAMAWIKGQVFTSENAKVSVFDRGFLFGDGVYETGRSYDRTFVFLEEHWKRLRSSAGKLAIEIPWSDAELEKGLFDVARAFKQDDIYFRTIVTRGTIESVGIENFASSEPSLVHIVQTLNQTKLDGLRKSGVKLLTSNVVRNASDAQDPNIKTSNYLNSLLALQDVKKRGADDAIMCNRKGHVTEGTTFSVFGITAAGRMITPSLNIGILDSITRRHVMEIASKNFKVEEGEYPVSTILDCAEVFIASSVREIVPVNSWDERRFDVPGPHTKALQEGLRNTILEYTRTHKKF